MRSHLYEVLKKRIRRQKQIYSLLLAAVCVVAFVGYFRSDGHMTLAIKNLYLQHHAAKLEEENQTLKSDMEELMPPCMESKEFIVTAYEKSARSCQKWAKYGKTSSNTVPAKFRTAAVDPAMIQVGSLIYAKGIGWLIAEDKGGAIKGRRMDIYMNTVKDALTFGKKKVTVYYQNNKCFEKLVAGNRYSQVLDEDYAYE